MSALNVKFYDVQDPPYENLAYAPVFIPTLEYGPYVHHKCSEFLQPSMVAGMV